MTLRVHVNPRASKDEIVGFIQGNVLKVRLTAPPVDGRANQGLVNLLAGHFRIPKSRITIRRGLAARQKVVDISGVDSLQGLLKKDA